MTFVFLYLCLFLCPCPYIFLFPRLAPLLLPLLLSLSLFCLRLLSLSLPHCRNTTSDDIDGISFQFFFHCRFDDASCHTHTQGSGPLYASMPRSCLPFAFRLAGSFLSQWAICVPLSVFTWAWWSTGLMREAHRPLRFMIKAAQSDVQTFFLVMRNKTKWLTPRHTIFQEGSCHN